MLIFLPVEQRVLFPFTGLWEEVGENGWLHCLALTDKPQMSSESWLCRTVSTYYNKLTQHILVVYLGRHNLQSFVSSTKRWMYFDHLTTEGFSTHLQPSVADRAAVGSSLPVNFIPLQIRPFHCYSSGASPPESPAFLKQLENFFKQKVTCCLVREFVS